MSAFYHICPRDANFQFGRISHSNVSLCICVCVLWIYILGRTHTDTAFMFIIGGLLIVKIFQNRHPDVHANAFIAFFSFAVVIFFTLVGIVRLMNNSLVFTDALSH